MVNTDFRMEIRIRSPCNASLMDEISRKIVRSLTSNSLESVLISISLDFISRRNIIVCLEDSCTSFFLFTWSPMHSVLLNHRFLQRRDILLVSSTVKKIADRDDLRIRRSPSCTFGKAFLREHYLGILRNLADRRVADLNVDTGILQLFLQNSLAHCGRTHASVAGKHDLAGNRADGYRRVAVYLRHVTLALRLHTGDSFFGCLKRIILVIPRTGALDNDHGNQKRHDRSYYNTG